MSTLGISIRACVIAALVLQPTTPAQGHTMSVMRGTVVVEPRRLTMTLAVPIGELHLSRSIEPAAHGPIDLQEMDQEMSLLRVSMMTRIAVRDDEGRRIPCQIQSNWSALQNLVMTDHEEFHRSSMTVSLEFLIPEGTEYLSLRQDTSDVGRGIASTIVFSVFNGSAPSGTIHLTRGGNVEVIRLRSPADANAINDPAARIKSFLQADALRSVRCVARVHDQGLRVSIYVPLQVMQTWVPADRAREEFLEVNDQIAYRSALSAFMVEPKPVIINGQDVTGRRLGVEFLDVGEVENVRSQPEGRLSAWTTRVQITTEFASAQVPTSFELHWTLFNPVVLSAQALVVSDGAVSEHDLSTYYPGLSWTAK